MPQIACALRPSAHAADSESAITCGRLDFKASKDMASHSGWIDLNVNDTRAPRQPKWSNVNNSSFPDGNLVGAYWAEKSHALGLNSSDIPEAWAFGGTADQADELLGLVLSGRKTATSSSLCSYQAEEEPLPAVGELSIVCDGQGRPRALLRLTDVTVTDFDEVSERHAFAEGEGDRTLAYWRRVHEDFFRSQLPAGCELTGSMPVVLESFERLAP